MKRSRVLLNFMSMNWKDLGAIGMLISSIFYTAAFFSMPPVTKAVLDAAIDDLREKGFVTIRRCKIAETNARISAEEKLKTLLKKNADYVNMMSEGDRTRIIESGYDVYTPDYNALAVVFTVVHGNNPGEVFTDWPSDSNSHGYIVRYAVNTDELRNTFTEVHEGLTGRTITGLERGTEYLFQMCVVYSDRQGPWTDPVIFMVT